MIQHLRATLLDLLFPPLCCACGEPLPAAVNQRFCQSCLSRTSFLISPLCQLCGTGLSGDGGGEDRWCHSCLQRRPPFDSARSLVYYRDPVRTLLQRLKYNGDTRVTAGLRSLIDEGGIQCGPEDYDLVVPVPLFASRLKQRGLNQALVLARLFFPAKSMEIDPTALVKVKNTPAQSELSGSERRKNLIGTIEVGAGAKLAGRRVCLVDDVFTTGATASECSLILKQNGAETVDVITFARA